MTNKILPLGWDYVRLGETGEYINGFAFKPAHRESDGLPIIRIQNLTDESKPLNRTTLQVSSEYEVLPGDLLVSWSATLDVFIWRRERALVNQHIFKVLPEERLIQKPLLFYWLKIAIEDLQETEHLHGSTMKHINRGPFLAHEVPLPPFPEQSRIVAKLEELLSDLDAGVAELKAAQRKLAQYRQSLLKAAVEGALTSDWQQQHAPAETGAQLLERILTERRARWEAKQLAKFQEQGKTPPKDWQKKYPEPVKPETEGLPGLPEGWVYCDLETFIPSDKTGTKTGPFGSLLKKHEHKQSGIPVVGIENIDRMQFSAGCKIHISLEKAAELSDYDLIPGDVVISRSGTVGEVCVIPESLGVARFSTNIMRIRVENDVISPEYFCLIFNGSPFVLTQINKLCSGSTRDFLNTEILKSLTFPIPPLKEQEVILELLNVTLAEVKNQDQMISISLKQSAAQRKNILKAAFTGQLVPQDPNDEPASVLLERIRAERAAAGSKAKTRRTKESA